MEGSPMFAKIDAILGPLVRWTNIVLGGGLLIWLLFFVPVITNPGTGAAETFRQVQAELDAGYEIPAQPSEIPHEQ
jgi:hypothetical protein